LFGPTDAQRREKKFFVDQSDIFFRSFFLKSTHTLCIHRQKVSQTKKKEMTTLPHKDVKILLHPLLQSFPEIPGKRRDKSLCLQKKTLFFFSWFLVFMWLEKKK